MYETEANLRLESVETISPEIVTAFSQLTGRILSRTVLPWSEHCTECVWPGCYKTCDLYSPREDGRCRRFVDGMVRIDCPTAINRYLVKIRFKQWGKLWTPGSLNLRSIKRADQIETRDYQIGTALYQLPLPRLLKNVVLDKRYSQKKRQAIRSVHTHDEPTCFLLECYNPGRQTIDLSVTIRSFRKEERVPFQRLIELRPGFNLVKLPFEQISKVVDLTVPFNIELIPNEIGEEVVLYFGLMEFVHEALSADENIEKIKCVVWDLDDTLWDGVLLEQGADNLRLKPAIVEIIKSLDRRGILQSVASKNGHEDAMQALQRFGISEFFLYPQISWEPKGNGIRAIATKLNLGIESLLFVDDSKFELMQVESSCPGVRVFNAQKYLSLLQLKEFDIPVTQESIDRRKMYQVEQHRRIVNEDFRDDYKAFLRHCDIRVTVCGLSNDNLERVHEVTQRTNQMNFSGNRYDRDVLRRILQTPYLDTYVITCQDRFGTYGVVGFGIVDSREPRMTDLMFSCRIQSKRVEHAVLRHIVEQYVATGKVFHANYRKTTRNMPSGQVFADLGMEEIGVADNVTSLVLPSNIAIPDDGIIQVKVQGHPVQMGSQ